MRRVKKYHDHVHNKTTARPREAGPRRPRPGPLEGVSPEDLDDWSRRAERQRQRQVVKTKQFALKPMSISEATLQIELVGHDFFVFTNAETSRTNVLYRRNDGHYGLIEPAEN